MATVPSDCTLPLRLFNVRTSRSTAVAPETVPLLVRVPTLSMSTLPARLASVPLLPIVFAFRVSCLADDICPAFFSSVPPFRLIAPLLIIRELAASLATELEVISRLPVPASKILPALLSSAAVFSVRLLPLAAI